MEELLPLGTIITVKGQEEELMIIGYYPVDNNRLYTYTACLYPYGIDDEKTILITNDKIDKIHFYGYQTQSLYEMRKKIAGIKDLLLQSKKPEEIINALKENNDENKE